MQYSIRQDAVTLTQSLISFTQINDDGSVSLIPVDWYNSQYQAYLAWVVAGNTPLANIPLLTDPAIGIDS